MTTSDPIRARAAPKRAVGDDGLPSQPGSFDDTRARLRHLSGSVCVLKEQGLAAEDARACVKGGADVFVNPAGWNVPWGPTCWPHEMSFWIENETALPLAKSTLVPIEEADPIECFLYESEDGEFVLVITGGFTWGPTLRSFADDGTTMPADVILLHPKPLSTTTVSGELDSSRDREIAFRIGPPLRG
ncbi:hypothetical protein Bequi_04230 [Brachybacterium sp. JHP9]|uniref:Uncharacterized protein n=1 Tax=Brachybacterium equifaecis TaxID=2910770 RepID=A0ABT0QZY2_9MICO|nr:hypothetical protein [Brachybacterium equifaecis]MCL6422599.1 hypothetical protein [Brachybacterium equifaecis]